MSVYFAGGLALFNLRAKAVKFLALGLAFTLVAQVYSLITLRTADLTPPNGIDIDTWRGTLRAGVLWGLVGGVVIYGAILAYAVRLRRRGILR
jgi:hypothetical protein